MVVIPNKSLGQHWLQDRPTLTAIADLALIIKADTVLEIGPGMGTLTQVLAKQAGSIVAVEFDKELATKLPKRVQAANITVIHDDILRYDLTELPSGYKVVANVPYYITSKIVRLLLESKNPPSIIVLLVQKEVAERLAAGPGSMSTLSVSAQFYADLSLGPVVKAELFTPLPKVDSQVVCLTYKGPRFNDIEPRIFFMVVKAGFSKRRKKLRSSLAGSLRLERSQVDAILRTAGIDPNARAQELSLDDWHRLSIEAKKLLSQS